MMPKMLAMFIQCINIFVILYGEALIIKEIIAIDANIYGIPCLKSTFIIVLENVDIDSNDQQFHQIEMLV